MKVVQSLGGGAKFRIPKNWIEEREEDLMMFYAPGPNAGTLRLSVLEARGSKAVDKAVPSTILKESQVQHKGKLEKLGQDRWLLTYAKRSKEKGESLYLAFWMVEEKASDRVTNSIFSYTLLEGQQDEPQYRAEIQMLDREIRNMISQ
jgi:hypothetical protein